MSLDLCMKAACPRLWVCELDYGSEVVAPTSICYDESAARRSSFDAIS